MSARSDTIKTRGPATRPDFKPEEKRVIFASSLGTVFEWYDFYLYAMLAPFFAALFFPPGNETAALLSAFAAYAAGFLVRPFGALVFGRIGDLVGRKYTFLVTIVVMGISTFARRPAADLRDDRLGGADPAGQPAPAAGPRARRRVRRRGDLRGRARAQQPPRLRHELDPDHRDARLLPGAGRDRPVPRQHGRQATSPSGAGASRSGLADPARLLDLHPAQAAGVAGLPADEGRGQGLEVAADRQLPQVPEQQVRAARAARRHRRARASSGTRGSSTRCSSSPSR